MTMLQPESYEPVLVPFAEKVDGVMVTPTIIFYYNDLYVQYPPAAEQNPVLVCCEQDYAQEALVGTGQKDSAPHPLRQEDVFMLATTDNLTFIMQRPDGLDVIPLSSGEDAATQTAGLFRTVRALLCRGAKKLRDEQGPLGHQMPITINQCVKGLAAQRLELASGRMARYFSGLGL
ncbi:MAG TPA: hypothetical protein DCY07_03280 [Rhodospirillaceae bacterium]|nr:hypothetical protein [Rhodospirillaceae bacterium]